MNSYLKECPIQEREWHEVSQEYILNQQQFWKIEMDHLYFGNTSPQIGFYWVASPWDGVLSTQQEQIGRLRVENEKLKEKIRELQEQNPHLSSDQQIMQRGISVSSPASAQSKKRRNNDVERVHHCPYDKCSKAYGSELAMNLHIKQKHNGCNKTQRQTFAKIIMECKEKGLQPPKIDCNFPPGFLQDYELKFISSKMSLQNQIKSTMKEKSFSEEKQ